MADDKNLASLKVTITADKSPLKKALDSAKQDTEKSTSQIQGILQKIKKTMSSVSLKGMVKDFQVKSGIKVPTQEFQELRDGASQARDALANLLEKQKKLKALGVKEQSREWKSLQYDIEKAKNAVEGYKFEMSEMKANGTDVKRPVSLPKQALGLGKGILGGIGKVIGKVVGLGASAVSKGWGGLVRILGGVISAFSKVGGVIRRTSGLFGALIQKFTNGIPILNRFTGGVKDNGSSFGGGLKNLLKYSLGIRSLFALVNKLRSALVDGFKNLSQYSGDTNNSLSMLMSSLTQLKNAFAAAFAPVLNIVAPILNAVIQKIISVVNAIGQLTSALTGAGTFIKAKQLNQNYAASLDKNTKSANKANDANQKLQRTILGFDQINKLDDTSGNSSSDSAATGGLTEKDMFETLNVSNEMRAIAAQIKEAWKNADFTEIGRIVGRKLNSALQNIPWGSIQSTCNRIAKSTATFLNGFIEETDWQLVGNTLSQGINTAFGTANTFAENFHWGSLGNAVGNGINGALGSLDWNQINTTVCNIAKGLTDGLNSLIQTTDWSLVGQTYANKLNTIWSALHTSINNFDWIGAGNALSEYVNSAIQTVDFAGIGDTFSDGLKGLLDFGITAIEGIDWYQLGEKVWEGLATIDWNGIADRTFELIGASFGGLAAFLGGVISEGVQETKQYFQDKIEECGGNVVEGIFKGIVDGVEGIGAWIKKHIFEPFINGFKNAFGIHSPSTVMVKQGGYIISGLLKGLKDNIGSTLDWVGKIPGQVKDKVSDAKSWLLETGGNALAGLKEGLDDKWSSIGDWFGNLPNKISSVIPNLFDTGKNAIQNFANGFGSVHIPLPHVSVSWNKHKVGPMSFSTPKFAFNWYAKGGFPESGEMFMARESGPELVGRMGSKNAVANNNQIIEGIRAGVYDAVVNALESRSQSKDREAEIHIYLEGDADKLFKIVRKKGQQYQKSTGKPVFS